jgi:uncharacterized protein
MIIIQTRTQEEYFELSGEELPAVFDIDPGQHLWFKDNIEYELKVQKTPKDIIISGTVKTVVTHECSRCLNSFSQKINVKDVLYSFSLDTVGDTIDLTSYIREEILLLLPLRPLCSEGCKGLCPSCGKSLNDAPCNCIRVTANTAFDVLDKLIDL